jgi:hypothetical protein
MEINVTEFVKNENPVQFQQSIAESGLQNISQITWDNAKESEWEFVNEDNKQDVIDHFAEYGAWDDLEEWSINELNALLIQDISASIREWECYDSYEEIEQAMEDGQISSRLYQSSDEYYFYIGT